jgi:hypothetical protein
MHRQRLCNVGDWRSLNRIPRHFLASSIIRSRARTSSPRWTPIMAASGPIGPAPVTSTRLGSWVISRSGLQIPTASVWTSTDPPLGRITRLGRLLGKTDECMPAGLHRHHGQGCPYSRHHGQGCPYSHGGYQRIRGWRAFHPRTRCAPSNDDQMRHRCE